MTSKKEYFWTKQDSFIYKLTVTVSAFARYVRLKLYKIPGHGVR